MRLLLSLLSFFGYACCYKILVYSPKIGHSHSNYVGRIADILVDAGHDVTTLIPQLARDIADGTTKSKIIHVPANEAAAALNDQFMNDGEWNFFETKIIDLPMIFFGGPIFGGMMSDQCETTLDQPGLIDKLKKEKFDVVLTENFDYCGMAISHLISPKAVIMLSSAVLMPIHYGDLGVPTVPSYNPSFYTTSLDVYSFVSRAWNLVSWLLSTEEYETMRRNIQSMLKKRYGDDFPSFTELTSRVAFALINSEPLIDFATPSLHRVIPIGGLGARPPAKLNEYWSEILSRRPRNVLVSFGSVARTVQMNSASKSAMLELFRFFPDVTFIWKYEAPNDTFGQGDAAAVDNLVLSKWTPQNDILSHPNISAFISHGGSGSVQETAIRGVPAIFIPLFGDQSRNAAMMEYNGLGKVLDKFDLDKPEILKATLRAVLEDEQFSKKAKHVSRMLAAKPFASKDLLLKHVEFAAEFGPSSALRPASQDMNFVEYFNLDIAIIALLLVSLASFVFLKLSGALLSSSLKGVVVKEKRA